MNQTWKNHKKPNFVPIVAHLAQIYTPQKTFLLDFTPTSS